MSIFLKLCFSFSINFFLLYFLEFFSACSSGSPPSFIVSVEFFTQYILSAIAFNKNLEEKNYPIKPRIYKAASKPPTSPKKSSKPIDERVLIFLVGFYLINISISSFESSIKSSEQNSEKFALLNSIEWNCNFLRTSPSHQISLNSFSECS